MPTYGFRVRCRITKWLLKVPRRNGVLVAVTSIRQGTVAQGNESGMAQVWRSGKVLGRPVRQNSLAREMERIRALPNQAADMSGDCPASFPESIDSEGENWISALLRQ